MTAIQLLPPGNRRPGSRVHAAMWTAVITAIAWTGCAVPAGDVCKSGESRCSGAVVESNLRGDNGGRSVLRSRTDARCGLLGTAGRVEAHVRGDHVGRIGHFASVRRARATAIREIARADTWTA